jgi:predicted nucleotidyltransferase
MNRQDIIDYLKAHREEFARKYQVSKILLFGSYARDEYDAKSDIDVAVETELSDYFRLYDLKEELESAFQTKVDLVRLRDRMNTALKNRILKDGIHV